MNEAQGPRADLPSSGGREALLAQRAALLDRPRHQPTDQPAARQGPWPGADRERGATVRVRCALRSLAVELSQSRLGKLARKRASAGENIGAHAGPRWRR